MASTTVIFSGNASLTVDSANVMFVLGDTQAASGPPVVGNGSAVQQVAGRSIASGNMNAMRWIAKSHLIVKTLGGISFAWIPFTTNTGAATALTAIQAAIDASDPSVTIAA